jgi:5-methylcytosine-specific restriction enzyme A
MLALERSGFHHTSQRTRWGLADSPHTEHCTSQAEDLMSQILQMRPTTKGLVIDLARAAGVDVADWSNYSNGETKAASNPKYCYEWSFVEPGEVVVLNLWYDQLREQDGSVFQSLNMRRTARDLQRNKGAPAQIRRASAADEAIRTAFEDALLVRVIINDGARRKEGVRGASRVKARRLDEVVWHVGAYDFVTGAALIVRGERGDNYVDQFSVPGVPNETPASHWEKKKVFDRDATVRAAVLARARGRCEHCGEPGFSMPNCGVYLETHHVVPLAEGGPDTRGNVIALCPNHHRRAHHGVDRSELRAEFSEHLIGLYPSAAPSRTAGERSS